MGSPPRVLGRVLLLSAVAVAALVVLALIRPAQSLRVMTFNVRYPDSFDGANAWEKRRDNLVQTLRKHRPDILGTQELFQTQAEYIVDKLPDYAWFGLSRHGDHEGEHMGIFYLKPRLRLMESGNFWLSKTPETPGSTSWNMSFPRMVTWGLFQTERGQRFYFLNTHFPYRREDDLARVECARVISSWTERLSADVPVLLTGDFNTGEDSETYQILNRTFKDAWKTAASREGPEGTFHGFIGTPGPSRIDWILYRGAFGVERAETATDHEGANYPSDHFPVVAEFQMK